MLGLEGSLGSGSLGVLLRWERALLPREGVLGALGVGLVVPFWISGMRWDGVRAWCPSLTPWPGRRHGALPGQPEEEAGRSVIELPPGHAEYMIKM